MKDKNKRETYISLGSNQGDRIYYMKEALLLIGEKFKILNGSSVYETEAWGYEKQAKFLNQVVCIETETSPEEVLDILKKIEKNIGRESSFTWGPRKIDIDILFMGSLIYNKPDIEIPHPLIQDRLFVLKPLKEISPDLINPASGKSIRQLEKECKDQLAVALYKPGR